MKIIIIIFSLLLSGSVNKSQANKPDAILGKWETVKNNLIVEVYKDHNDYKAKVIWFKNIKGSNKPQNMWLDEKNPDKALRTRKVLGMDVLENFVYNPKANRWEQGEIYDCTTGRTWNSSAWLTEDGFLKVRGFWHFEFIGQTLVFKRI